MDKEVLVQYAKYMEEIKDIRRRKEKLERQIRDLEKTIVADTVKGTRRDGTYGPIRIEGFPYAGHERKKAALDRYQRMLAEKEAELVELTCQAEAYIDSIEKSELRIMFRLYFIDNLSYTAVARRMNSMFPKRQIKYTDENIKKRIQRFFQNVPQCPD